MKVVDILHCILNRLQIGIEHGGRIDLFLVQEIDFRSQLRNFGSAGQDHQPE